VTLLLKALHFTCFLQDNIYYFAHTHRYIERQTTKLFDAHLQRKGASGRVSFDKKAKTLGLTVQQNNKDASTQNANVK
jgi:hypothetical protein